MAELADYLVAEIRFLEKAGVDFGFIAANTPHIVFDEVRARVALPMLSIVEAAFDEAARRGLKRPALMGTGFTMSASFYPDRFAKGGIPIVLPGEADRGYIHEKYMNELLKGKFLDATRAGLVKIIERLKREEKIDSLLLAGTELPLILREAGDLGIPVLDTTLIHVDAIVEAIVS
jgi:aspartate racemase